MSDGEEIERIVRLLRTTNQDSLIEIGSIPPAIPVYWQLLSTTRLMVTPERRAHMLRQHPEMYGLLHQLVATLHDPDEIHWDKNEPETTATFWRHLDSAGDYWIRASVRLAVQRGPKDQANSLITAWRIRKRGYLVEVRAKRRVWSKEGS